MPKLAANLSMTFNEVDFMSRFKAAANAGFKGVEYLFPYDFPKDALGEQLDKNGLEQVLFDLPAGDFANGERGNAIQPERRGEFQDGVGKALEYARALNCKRLTCLAGLTPKNAAPDKLQETLVHNLRFAAKEAAPYGITVLLEPLNSVDTPGFFLTGTDKALEIISAVGAPNLKLQYDVYHMQIMEGDLARTIQANKGVIGHFQIADNPGRHEPGTGEINYNFLLDFIDKTGYDGWIGCEYRPTAGTLAGLKWAEKYLKLRIV
jgi:hydroxypyruvate isomerase